jgi:hypothetical protein
MTREDAVSALAEQRDALALDPELRVASVERCIVEFSTDRSRPGPVSHRVAWIVTLMSAESFARVQIDDSTRRVLHVERSA